MSLANARGVQKHEVLSSDEEGENFLRAIGDNPWLVKLKLNGNLWGSELTLEQKQLLHQITPY